MSRVPNDRYGVKLRRIQHVHMFSALPRTRTLLDAVGMSQTATSADLDQILVRQWSAGELSELAADRERS
jgi:hypothetical protein